MKKTAEIYITGKVQGVFFRTSAQDQAKELGIKGFVENLSDGRLLIVAEGEEKVLDDFVEWLRIGPELADVENLDVSYEDYAGKFNNFIIK